MRNFNLETTGNGSGCRQRRVRGGVKKFIGVHGRKRMVSACLHLTILITVNGADTPQT